MASGFGCALLVATACLIQMVLLAKEKIYYVDLEHVNLTYWHPKYIRDVNVTCRRYSRKDPVHYCHLHGETLVPAGNHFLLDYYVYEFLSNEYRRSFVEAHFKLCDLFYLPIVSQFIDKIKGVPNTCPIPPMVYHVENFSIVDLPILRTFPFQKGRLFVNITKKSSDSQLENIASGYVDAIIKQMWR